MATHLSTRLVWHDRAWDGHICNQPSKNAYCIVHQHVRDARDDVQEDAFSGTIPAELDGSIDAEEIEQIARARILDL